MHPTDAPDGNGSGGGSSPAFDGADHALIRRWSAALRPRGLRVAVVTNYPNITEALHVLPRWSTHPRWLVWRTDTGRVALTQMPGLPTLVATLAEALALIESDVEAEDA